MKSNETQLRVLKEIEDQIKFDIKDEEIVDALVGAFEGGSNYWYNLPDTSMVPKIEGKYISERITIAALSGVHIPVYDLEEPEDKLGEISFENIKRGLKLYIEDGRSFNPCDMDAEDSDILLQYIVMGEIMFG